MMLLTTTGLARDVVRVGGVNRRGAELKGASADTNNTNSVRLMMMDCGNRRESSQVADRQRFNSTAASPSLCFRSFDPSWFKPAALTKLQIAL